MPRRMAHEYPLRHRNCRNGILRNSLGLSALHGAIAQTGPLPKVGDEIPMDPTLARARIEITRDRALLRQLTEAEARDGVSRSKAAQARMNALLRLIMANERLIERLHGERRGIDPAVNP